MLKCSNLKYILNIFSHTIFPSSLVSIEPRLMEGYGLSRCAGNVFPHGTGCQFCSIMQNVINDMEDLQCLVKEGTGQGDPWTIQIRLLVKMSIILSLTLVTEISNNYFTVAWSLGFQISTGCQNDIISKNSVAGIAI